MKTTHTPGPWHVGTHRGKPDYELILDKSDRVVCQMYDRFEDYFTNYEANAKLIAAAPELLDQLVKARELLVKNGFHTWSYVIIDIDNAIKKSTE